MKDRKMTRSLLTRRIAALAASLVLAATVSACGGDAKAPQPSGTEQAVQQTEQQAAVFTFESAGFSSPKQLTIQLPEGLKATMGADASNLLVNSYELAVRELDSPSYCAVDIKINYAEGGKERASMPTVAPVSIEEQVEREKLVIQGAVDAAMKEAQQMGYTGTSINDGLTKAFGPASSELWALLQWVGGNSNAVSALKNENAFKNWTGSYEDAIALINKRIDDRAQEAKDDANSVPAAVNVATRLFASSEGKPASELPASPSGNGVYVSDDLQTATVIRDCAPQPYDDSSDQELVFPLFADGKQDELATAYFTVMKGGDITVRDHKVRGYVLGSDGHWLKD